MKSLFKTINLFCSFLAGLLGGMFIILLAHPIVKLFQANNPLLNPESGSDVIAVANTYIVFTTFIFVLITIIVTGGGIWFSKWFGLSKDQEIRENMRELFECIDSDDALAQNFVKRLFEHREIADLLHQLVQARVQDEIKERDIEQEEAVNFSDDLSQE